MSTVADKLAKKSSSKTSAKQVRLRVAIDKVQIRRRDSDAVPLP